MDSRELIGQVRSDLKAFRDPMAPLHLQLRGKQEAQYRALAFIAEMGHADVNTARRLARMLIDA